jgi:hypothetical protein
MKMLILLCSVATSGCTVFDVCEIRLERARVIKTASDTAYPPGLFANEGLEGRVEKVEVVMRGVHLVKLDESDSNITLEFIDCETGQLITVSFGPYFDGQEIDNLGAIIPDSSYNIFGTIDVTTLSSSKPLCARVVGYSYLGPVVKSNVIQLGLR